MRHTGGAGAKMGTRAALTPGRIIRRTFSQFWNDDYGAEREAHNFLAHTTQRQSGYSATATPSKHNRIGYFACRNFHNRLCRITPTDLKLDVRYAKSLCTCFRCDEDLHRTILDRLGEILLGACEFPHFLPRKVSGDGHDEQFTTKGFGELGCDIHRAVGVFRTVGRYQNIPHR